MLQHFKTRFRRFLGVANKNRFPLRDDRLPAQIFLVSRSFFAISCPAGRSSSTFLRRWTIIDHLLCTFAEATSNARVELREFRPNCEKIVILLLKEPA